jgi:23S rRNA (uracil1939-C5)-methyltransferase
MTFEIVPQKLIYGGDALAHHEGRAVFVPRVLPGERAEVETVRIAKGVVHARPLRVLEPSPERIEPPCPYFGRCGGCDYQHLPEARQTAIKRDILLETLRRTGKIDWSQPIAVHSAQAQGYRNQAQFKVVRNAAGRPELGFFEAYSHRLFPIDSCLLLSPRLNQILHELRDERWSVRLDGVTEIELTADESDERAMLIARGTPSGGDQFAKELLESVPGVATVAIESGGGLRVFGEPHLHYSVGEFRYQVSPGSFFQVSRFLLPRLVDAISGSARGETALDLYAGVGLFTLPLAERFASVVAVEASAQATKDLAANAKARNLSNIRVNTATTQDFLRRFAQRSLDLVVLDPPRAGVEASALKLLAASQPKQIHYVSCSPPTLARDLAYLVAHGYDLESVEMFDFFPHTYHLESLAQLLRRAA